MATAVLGARSPCCWRLNTAGRPRRAPAVSAARGLAPRRFRTGRLRELTAWLVRVLAPQHSICKQPSFANAELPHSDGRLGHGCIGYNR
eukprot:504091-Pleurochrysis_carterae.AAC.2